MIVLHRFESSALAGAALADAIAAIVEAPDASAIALPGGRSPVPLFQSLFPRPLAWERVTVTLTDDRWVETDSPGSNQALIRGHMAGTPADGCRFIGLKTGHAGPEAGLDSLDADLAELPPLFDAVVLGMGDDGHVASLFPGQPLERSGRPCLPGRAPTAPARRISLSLGRLLATRRLFLLFGGRHRLDLIANPRPGLPVTEILARAACPVEVYVFPS